MTDPMSIALRNLDKAINPRITRFEAPDNHSLYPLRIILGIYQSHRIDADGEQITLVASDRPYKFRYDCGCDIVPRSRAGILLSIIGTLDSQKRYQVSVEHHQSWCDATVTFEELP